MYSQTYFTMTRQPDEANKEVDSRKGNVIGLGFNLRNVFGLIIFL